MRHGHRSRALAALGAAGLAAMLALAGCGAESSDGESSTAAQAPGVSKADQAGGAGAPAEQAPAESNGERAGAAEGQDAAQPGAGAGGPIVAREIIYTGTVTVRLDRAEKVDAVAAAIIGKTRAAGGYVGADDRTTGNQWSEGTLTLRVPWDKFTALVDEIGALGKEESRKIETQDVTEEVVDLDARIIDQRARVDSGRRLLAQAKTLSELVSMENELASRQKDLASLEAKKRRLADLTSLSTITVSILGPDSTAPPEDGAAPGFLAGLEGGWNALVAAGQVLLTVLGAVLPWALGLGLPIGAIYLAIRRFNRRRTSTSPAAPTPVNSGSATD